VTQLEQVKAVVTVLLESNKIRNATHNIMAYRIAAPGRPGVFYQDFDDDGEAAAGGRLLHLLQVITHCFVLYVYGTSFFCCCCLQQLRMHCGCCKACHFSAPRQQLAAGCCVCCR
jgi:hypothetical protein